MLYIVISVFIGGPLENQLVEGQPSLKESNMKIYEIWNMRSWCMKVNVHHKFLVICFNRSQLSSFF